MNKKEEGSYEPKLESLAEVEYIELIHKEQRKLQRRLLYIYFHSYHDENDQEAQDELVECTRKLERMNKILYLAGYRDRPW